MNIGKKFKKLLEQLEVIQVAFQSYPDQLRKETIENLVETLIYERIGTFLRRQLVSLYIIEESQFATKCGALVNIFKTDPNRFNQIFSCNLFPNMKPNKSLKIFKLFLNKSQLPYEMLFVLGKCMQTVA